MLGKAVYFLTNNSAKTRADYKDKLAQVNGLDVPESSIFTSAYATALYLKARAAEGKRAFVIGEPGLAQELAASAGLIAVTRTDDVSHADIDYVVVGIDRKFTYDKLLFAHAAITRGRAQFIATNRDATLPTEDHEVPGGGSLVAAVAMATSRGAGDHRQARNARLRGHLSRCGRQGFRKPHGRRPAGHGHRRGRRVGAQTVLVLTGVTSPQMAQRSAPPEWRPDRIIGDLRELV